MYVFQDDKAHDVHRGRITESCKQENNINCTTWPAVSGLKWVWKCLASHKQGTTTNRWRHQHPKRTFWRNSTCVGKCDNDFIKPFQHR